MSATTAATRKPAAAKVAAPTFTPAAADRWGRSTTSLVDSKGRTVARVTTLPAGSEDVTGGRYMVEVYGTKADRFHYFAKPLEARNAARALVKALAARKADVAALDAEADALVG